MADISRTQGRWAFRLVPPEPRSIVELIGSGVLDAELAATVWLLLEARVPIVVAAEAQHVGKTTLLTALLDFLPPASRVVELAGEDETFDWLPQASELGWPGVARPAAAGSDPIRPVDDRPARPRAVRSHARLHLGRRRPGRGPGRLDRLRPGRDDPCRLARRGLRPAPPAAGPPGRRRAVAPGCRPHRPPARRRTPPRGRGALRPADGPRRARPSPAARARRPRDLGSRRGRLRAVRLGDHPRARASRRTPGGRLRDRARPSSDRPRRRSWRPARATPRRSAPPSVATARPRRLTLRGTTLRLAVQPGNQGERIVDPIAQDKPSASTLADLRASGWRSRTVKEELRANLLERLAVGSQVFPGVVGYEESVVPAIENAILAGHDLVFLGERGQAKTRMARLLVGLLDAWLPIVRGGELNDDPFAPVSPAARAIVERDGDATADRLAAARPALRREARDARHHDRRPHRRGRPDQGRRGPLPVRRADPALRPHPARQPRHRRDQRAAGPGRADPGRPAQHPRGARRPDPRLRRPAAARPVHGRLGQPGGLHLARPDHHPAQGPARVADPDPLSRGRSTTRWRSSARRSTASRSRTACPWSSCPAFMEELVAELTHLARRSPEISQRSGVSVRVSVANAEVLEAAALKRAVRLGEPVGAPRVSDLGAVVASTVGKVELESIGDDAPEERIVERLITKALHTTFNRHASLDELEGVVEAFEDGFTVETGDRTPVARVRRLDARGARALDGAVRPPRRVRRHRRRRGARGRRLGRRVPARGPAPGAAAQQGPRARAGRSTTGDRVLPGSTRSGAGSDARRSAPRRGETGGRRAGPRGALLRAGTAASMSPTSRPTRSSMRSPTTSWPRATWPRRSAA